MTWWTKYAGIINPLDLRNRRPFPNYRPLPRLSLRLIGQRPAITGWPRDPGFHLISLSLSVIIVANIAIDNATIITIQIFWTELWNFYRQKSSYSIRSRQPEIIKILRPPKRILSSFPSHPKTTEEHPRHTHARSNAVTCVSMSVCNASVLRSRQHLGRGKWRLPHPPWYAGTPRMIIVSQIKHLKWDIELKTCKTKV